MIGQCSDAESTEVCCQSDLRPPVLVSNYTGSFTPQRMSEVYTGKENDIPAQWGLILYVFNVHNVHATLWSLGASSHIAVLHNHEVQSCLIVHCTQINYIVQYEAYPTRPRQIKCTTGSACRTGPKEKEDKTCLDCYLTRGKLEDRLWACLQTGTTWKCPSVGAEEWEMYGCAGWTGKD